MGFIENINAIIPLYKQENDIFTFKTGDKKFIARFKDGKLSGYRTEGKLCLDFSWSQINYEIESQREKERKEDFYDSQNQKANNHRGESRNQKKLW